MMTTHRLTPEDRATVHLFKNLVSRVTYKPGYTLTVHDEPDRLSVTMMGPDHGVDPWGGTQTRGFFFHSWTPYGLRRLGPERFLRYEFFRWIIDCERHEAAEFFKLDGEWVQHPHPPEHRPDAWPWCGS